MASATTSAPRAHHQALTRSPAGGTNWMTTWSAPWPTARPRIRWLQGWAAAVPTRTGTMAAGRVRGRAPRTQRMTGPGTAGAGRARSALTGGTSRADGRSRATGETTEVRGPVLLKCVAALLALLAHV